MNQNQDTFKRVVKQLGTVLDKKGNHLNMSSIIVSDGNNRNNQYTHYFKRNLFKQRERVDVRSIAKPIVCMAIGAAIEKGLYFNGVKIDLNTPIWQFLSKYTTVHDPENIKKWQKVTLMDCFRITLGHDKGLMFSADVKEHDEYDLVNYIVNYPITREIGRDFVYSNDGTYLVSSLITEYLGRNLDKLVDEFVFAPMNITGYTWKKYGKYCAGCTGLKIYNEDLHKIGRLIMNNGIYKGKQLVPHHWIEKMRTPQVPSPTHRYVADREFPKWSYGMNLWICQDGNYYCDGTDAQYMIIIPKKNILVTTLGHQSDTEPVSNCLGAFK